MVKNPRRRKTAISHQAPDANARWWHGVRERLAIGLGRLANWLGAPGAIKPATIHDRATGVSLSVTVGPLFTRVSVNGRDFYFTRFCGEFDGTGADCS